MSLRKIIPFEALNKEIRKYKILSNKGFKFSSEFNISVISNNDSISKVLFFRRLFFALIFFRRFSFSIKLEISEFI